MGEALWGAARARGVWRRTAARLLAARAACALAVAGALAVMVPAGVLAQQAPVRLDRGRFTVVAYPVDLPLAHALLDSALADDSFPGLPRPTAHVLLAIAPDAAHFRKWIGPNAPEWGAAITFPDERRIVMQGRAAGSEAGNPARVLRHELAHLALHEALDDLPPRWFDEGYASYSTGEAGRGDGLTVGIALALQGVPPLDSLDARFEGTAGEAATGYVLSEGAVAEMASLDPRRGLALFLRYWRETGSIDDALRRAYGVTEAGFERRWRGRMMGRYGALALAGNITFATAIVGLLVLPLFAVRRRRDRARLAAMRAAEAATDQRERESAIAALLDAVSQLRRDAPEGEGEEEGEGGNPGSPA